MENPCAPRKDPGIEIVRFSRSTDQNHILGIYTSHEVGIESENTKTSSTGLLRKIEGGDFTLEDLHGEVLQFSTPCPNCGVECETNMKVTSILLWQFQTVYEKCVLNIRGNIFSSANWTVISNSDPSTKLMN